MFGKRTYCILGTMLLAVATLGAGVSAEQSEEPLESIEFDNDNDTGCWIEIYYPDDPDTLKGIEWRDPCPVVVGVVAEADIDSGNNTTMVRIAGGGSGVLADTGCWVVKYVGHQAMEDPETGEVVKRWEDPCPYKRSSSVDTTTAQAERADDLRRGQCERGTLRGVFTLDESGNGTMNGLVYNEDGQVISNIWGEFDTDGFAHGLVGASTIEPGMQWKAVYMDGEFSGLWKMLEESDEAYGVLKGYYEVNEAGDSGVFKGKWKETGCHHMLEDVDRSDLDEVRPRHAPIKIDADRIDTRPMDISPKQKPLMEKLGDVMDEPLVEDEGGTIVDIGDAAAGSTLGTIALLGAGFIRRRITGGL